MIRYRFGQRDLLRTRFAIAPLIELIGCFYALRKPRRFAVHRPWTEWAGPRVAELDLTLLDVATPFGTGYWPVFLGPPPAAPRAEISDELERVLATPAERVGAEFTQAYPNGVPEAGRPFLEDPETAVGTLVSQMHALWEAAVAPWWPRLSALLEAEIASPARKLVAVGSEAAFADLHPTVAWEAGTLSVHPTRKWPADVDLGGRGLLLVPAAFTWPNVWPRTDPPWDPALVYPPPGVADLWAPDRRRGEALDALVGRRRARILRELERPASTQELGKRIAVGAASVSDHLGVLRRAGLVTARREGRRVIYSRTAVGEMLAEST